MNTSIIPECYVDTCLIETLVPPFKKGKYNHQKGCPAVAKAMQEDFADRFALGIMDKDKKEVKYLQEFDLIKNTESLYLFKHRKKHHYIIQIAPACEKFMLKAAAELGVSLADNELSDDLEGLKKFTKHQVAGDNPVLKNAVGILSSAKDFRLLKAWIMYLRENTYKCDIEKLKSMV